MSNKQKTIFLGLLIAILGALAFYFFYWTKTPQYSITLIQQAVKNHNVDKFERYVDLDTLYGRAYDDFISKSVVPKNDTEKMASTFATGIMQMFKPTVVSALKDATLKEISGTQSIETSAKQQKGDVKEGIKIISDINKNTVIKNISVISKESEVANIGITLHDKELESDFVLKVKMNKLENGEWRVKEITNLIEYLDSVKKTKMAKAKERDKAASEMMKKYIRANFKNGGVNGVGGSSGWVSKHYVNVTAELFNITEQTLKDIKVFAKIIGKNGEHVKTLEFPTVEAIAAKRSHLLSTEVKLDSSNSNDKKLLNEDLRKYFVEICVMRCKTADGTVIERPMEIINEKP